MPAMARNRLGRVLLGSAVAAGVVRAVVAWRRIPRAPRITAAEWEAAGRRDPAANRVAVRNVAGMHTVPSTMWIRLPTAGLELWQNSGAASTATVTDDLTVLLAEGPRWAVRPHQPERPTAT